MGYNPQGTRKAIDWFRSTSKAIRDINVNQLHAGTPNRLVSRIEGSDIGSMFSFFYDPKHKDTLPYWDQHPLILPFGVDNKGFIGYNLHYVSPYQRAKIMDGLYKIAGRYNGNPIAALPINYGMLKGLSRMEALKPCIKRYLWPHVMSRFMYIRPEEWDMAMMLPTARWAGSSPHSVYRDSAKNFASHTKGKKRTTGKWS